MSERLRFAAARVLDDIAWPFFLPLEVCPFFGARNPLWLMRAVVWITAPLQTRALRLRGWNGVSGS